MAPVAALLVGCSGAVPGQSTVGSTPNGVVAQSQSLAQPRGQLWRRPANYSKAINAAAANAHLTNHGGPVIANINAFIITWGPQSNIWPDGLSALQSYWSTIPTSPYITWLSEYNTSSQQIGTGSFGGVIEDASAPIQSTIDDSQIAAELTNLVNAGTITPDDNTYYQIVFPPGITITSQNTSFCVQTDQGTPCAYHNSVTVNGQNVYYSPQPDYSGECGTLCGFVPGNNVASLTTATSHEMAEAITDADVGNNNLAWYDSNNNAEIGDICEVQAQGQQIDGIYVQTEWSNALNKCIISNSSTTTCDGCVDDYNTCQPGNTNDACGTGGNSCVACGTDQTCSNGQCTY